MKIKAILSLIFVFFMAACSSDDVYDTNSAEGAFKSAEKYEKDERYEEAITRFRDVLNKHPIYNHSINFRI
jgi:outer membrane protein assembly factor BamD (BamD/ComL family)